MGKSLRIHFVTPTIDDPRLQELKLTSPDRDYPYWLGGAINWPTQTYLHLREHREGVSIGTAPESGAVNIAHVDGWRKWGRSGDEFRVSIRADHYSLAGCDFEIHQNRAMLSGNADGYVTYWPVPRMIPRDPNRYEVRSVAYAGRVGPRNISSELLQSSGGDLVEGRLKLCRIESQKWHDMREVDILVAIRSFSRRTYDDKPPSKLLNAWNAGIPLIAGWDSAYSAIGTPGVDYLRVESGGEFTDALRRLADDPEYYKSVVDAGRKAVLKFTTKDIVKEWFDLLDGPVSETFRACPAGIIRSMRRRASLCLDSSRRAISRLKRATFL